MHRRVDDTYETRILATEMKKRSGMSLVGTAPQSTESYTGIDK